jgi:enamine deaminase RidA (YjgF/YER057c/UK114 family)
VATRYTQTLRRWPACVAAGPLLYFAGQRGLRSDAEAPCLSFDDIGNAAPGAGSRFAWVNRIEGPVGAQTIAIYRRLRQLLEREGGDLTHLVRMHFYQLDKRYFPVFDRVRRHHESAAPAASTALGMRRFDPDGAARFCVDGIALRPSAAASFGARRALSGAAEQAAAASYSHVIGAGPLRFIAGQVPIDTAKPGAPLIRGYDDIPEAGQRLRTGKSHEDSRNGPIAAQTWFTYDLIGEHLRHSGSSLAQLLNLTVYLQDMRDFPTFHRVHEQFFPVDPPALTVIAASEVGHRGTLIEIEPTALALDAPIERRAIAAPSGIAPAQMSVLVEAGGTAFVSGMLGLSDAGDPVTSFAELPQRLRHGLKKGALAAKNPAVLQGLMALGRIEQALSMTGVGLNRVVHLTIFMVDVQQFLTLEPFLARAFGSSRPALTVLETPAPGPIMDAVISMTAVAWVGEGEPEVSSR